MNKDFNSLTKHIKLKVKENMTDFTMIYEDFSLDFYIERNEEGEHIYTFFEGYLKGEYVKTYTHETFNKLLKEYSYCLNIDYDVEMHGFYTHGWSFLSRYEIQKESIYFAFWYLFYTVLVMTQKKGELNNLSNKTKEMFLKLIHLDSQVLNELPEIYLTINHA